ncbi:MAG: hypothetical protein OEV53_08795 [Nitrospira sp.]|nr:hypothetical protein [Nitrospira sp.]MDH5194776.1 hypothetical protein [Nitrospira sp.]
MRYDPEAAPDPETWLALDEAQRIELIMAHHPKLDTKIPNAQLHAAIHTIVENQLAEKIAVTKDALARLCAEGLDRHEAIHAIGSVLIGHIQNLLQADAKASDPNAPYSQALQRLTASSVWHDPETNPIRN